MRLTFLGTGSAMPTGRRAQSGLLVTRADRPGPTDTDAAATGAPDAAATLTGPLLIDCGSGVLDALTRTDVGYTGVEAVLLTHHHTDHVADLLPLLKARWLAGAEPLAVYGPPGTETLLRELLAVHEYLEGRVEYVVTDLPMARFPIDVAGRTVAAVHAAHATNMTCLAYRIDDRLAVSGDTEASDAVAAFADGAAALVHDCSFPDSVDVDNHPTPTRLGQVLAGHDYGTVYLTHLYPHTEGHHEAMRAAIEANYEDTVRFAHDGLTVSVSPERADDR